MHLIDYVLIGIIVLAVIGAFVSMRRRKKNGSGCCGQAYGSCGRNCESCSRCGNCKK